jgi:hypothetical protein
MRVRVWTDKAHTAVLSLDGDASVSGGETIVTLRSLRLKAAGSAHIKAEAAISPPVTCSRALLKPPDESTEVVEFRAVGEAEERAYAALRAKFRAFVADLSTPTVTWSGKATRFFGALQVGASGMLAGRARLELGHVLTGVAVLARAIGERRCPTLTAGLSLWMAKLARTYEFPITALREADGTPARLLRADRLKLSLSGVLEQLKLWATSEKFDFSMLQAIVTVTDRPVVESPTAVYAVLLLTQSSDPDDRWLRVPLHAQSPMSERTAFGRLKDDFRRGYIRYTGAFPWLLSIPGDAMAASGAAVVNVDRNGQMWPAEQAGQFVSVETPFNRGE